MVLQPANPEAEASLLCSGNPHDDARTRTTTTTHPLEQRREQAAADEEQREDEGQEEHEDERDPEHDVGRPPLLELEHDGAARDADERERDERRLVELRQREQAGEAEHETLEDEHVGEGHGRLRGGRRHIFLFTDCSDVNMTGAVGHISARRSGAATCADVTDLRPALRGAGVSKQHVSLTQPSNATYTLSSENMDARKPLQ